jgi:pseudomonalisin
MSGRKLWAAAAAAVCMAFAAASPAFAAPGLAPVRAQGSSDQGAAGGSPLAITIALSPRSGLDTLLADQAAGRAASISPADFNARYAPSAATVAAVAGWAHDHGLRVESVSANRELIRVTGSADAIGSALGTSIHRYRTTSGLSYRAPARAATLPTSFAGSVAAVVGLSDLGRASVQRLPRVDTTRTAAASSLSFPADYGPQGFWSLYNAPSSQTGSGQTVAVIAEGDVSQPQKDLVTFEQKFGLPQVPWTTIQVGAPSSDTSGDDEWDLDTQYSTGFAPNVSSLLVYDGPSLGNSDIVSTINRWVTDNRSKQASFSAGECEEIAQVTGFQTALDNVLKQAQAQGQTLFTSSGDTGSFCPAVIGVNGVPAGVPGDNYPASSAGAIGVGGTTVLGPGNEVAWYAGGGGSSLFEATPSWQQNAGGSFTGLERGVPDVSLDADPNSGYDVIVAGQEQIIGGTSASAPSWQGIWARAQGAHGGAIGFAGPVVYGEPGSAFHDITVGANGLYAATPGWDYVTGRGTPDITAFVAGA